MAGEIKLNDVSVATEDAGTVTVGNSNVTFDANTVTTNLAFAANHAGIKAALNASGNPGIYACRAWVNFNGDNANSSFTEANGGIRSQGNVSSVTNNGTGDYRVNFTNAMPDRNYTVTVSCYGQSSGGKNASVCTGSSQTETGDSAFQTGYIDLTVTVDNGSTKIDLDVISVAIFK